ncbi:uncharacterized protein LOC129721507 [Wyeomyia smithii]|uniref:uncharacterized protein LOC129721507 n=1 Tax=Wyeomyia smithii TaxID=174621 RepID=UPI002467ED92|nr:uncharacterized protein LOC129721507 [Wyeomyia smithii]
MNTVPIYTLHNSFDLFADPIHTPITFGNEGFILTQQDQRNIVDRRTWYLSRPAYHPAPYSTALNPIQPPLVAQASLQELLFQLINFLSMHHPAPTATPTQNQTLPLFNFHYEKQTSTDDLAFYQRQHGGPCFVEPKLPPMVQRIQYIVSRSIRDAGVNTDEPQPIPAETTAPMDYDPGEGTSAGPEKPADYCLINEKPGKKVQFW